MQPQRDGVSNLLYRRLPKVSKRSVVFVDPGTKVDIDYYLRAVGRKILWSAACVCLSVCVCVCLSVCLSVCVCALFLSARYLKNGFMDHHQIWWVGAGGEPLEEVQFWC